MIDVQDVRNNLLAKGRSASLRLKNSLTESGKLIFTACDWLPEQVDYSSLNRSFGEIESGNR